MKIKKVDKRKVKPVIKQKTNDPVGGSNKHLYNSIFGILILSAAILLIVSMVFTSGAGPFGEAVSSILKGVFGASGYLFPFIVLYLGWIILTKKNPGSYRTRILCMGILLLLSSCFLYIFFSSDIYNPQAQFLKNVSNFYNEGKELYGGGVIGGLLTVPLIQVFEHVGAFIILLTAFIITLIIGTNFTLGTLAAGIKSFSTSIIGIISRSKPVKGSASEVKDENILKKPKKVISENEGMTNTLEINDYADRKVIDFEKELNNKNRDKAAREKEQTENVKEFNDKIKPGQSKGEEAEELNLDHNTLRKLDEDYKYPPIEILKSASDNGKVGSKKELQDTAVKLEQTLASFGVNARVINVSRGPTVTRYELSPGAGVKVSKIVGLADDLALNLAAPAVRIEAPIPGKAAVGIEIPNKELAPVYLRDVVESREFKNHASNLAFAIGKDIAGRIVIGDIAKMPHLLIAGATGSGKSVCINTLITSILYKARPDQVKLLMIDPKVVELGIYNGIPHLLIPVVTDPKKAAGALNWAVQEMVSRYNLFADKGVRDIKGYNAALKEEGIDALLPQVVVIIDELADLMMVAPNDVEDAICRLAQMARAAGMHLVVATQRPSVDVITGVIKANIPSRISFAVSSQVDSRTILDMAGAEKLLGKGDMLYYPIGEPKPIRLQGALISDKEVEAAVDFIKGQAEASYNEDILEKLESEGETVEADPGDNDVLLPQVIDMVVETGQASISIIQRRFKVGYARAARLIDQMEARGIVGGFEGSKPRRVLVSKHQWEEMKAE